MAYRKTLVKDFNPWHRAAAIKPEEGERVFVYFRYKYSTRQMVKASAHAFARWKKGRWIIENFPVNAEVVTWQYENEVDWDELAFFYDWIDLDEYRLRLSQRGSSEDD